MSNILEAIKCPKKVLRYLLNRRIGRLLSDEQYLKIIYRLNIGKKLDLKNPKTFNEKLQWLKLYDRKDIYTDMVDKCRVKKLVADKIGEEYIIPTIAEWDSFDEIDFDALPDRFVLKCNHDSGGLVICTDKSKLDINAARKKINRCLKTNYYWKGREWPYKNVKPKILAEKYMVDESGYELKDYKFFCFDGEVKALYIASDRTSKTEETKFDFYDAEFNHLPFTNGHPNSNKEIKKPESFEKMKKLAAVLSKDTPHVRIDFYDIKGQVYFGEITLFHMSGVAPFVPEEWDYTFGKWIELKSSKQIKAKKLEV